MRSPPASRRLIGIRSKANSHAATDSGQSSARRTRAGSKASPHRAANLDFGPFGLKAMEPDRVTARQIEAARRALTA